MGHMNTHSISIETQKTGYQEKLGISYVFCVRFAPNW